MKQAPFFSIIVISLFAFSQSAWAFCKPFWPPERTFEPTGDMQVFINFDDGIERMVVQPGFKGTIDDFGMVVAVPSRPVLAEAPEFIFDDLENLTNPFQPMPLFGIQEDAVSSTAEVKSVTVIEEKNVGDFTTTILRANDVDALTDWLDDNGYSYTDDDIETFEYYISLRTYYFVALKINVVDNAQHDDEGFFGKLSPIELSFAVNYPVVPIRIMKADMDEMELTIYTLGEDMYYLPGVNTLFSQKITDEYLPEVSITCFTTPCTQPDQWADEYEAREGKWLVRQQVMIEPRNISGDVLLSKADKEYEVKPQEDGKRVIRSDLFHSSFGIIKGDAPIWGAAVGNTKALLLGTRLLRWGSVGTDVAELQTFLNTNLGLSLKLMVFGDKYSRSSF